MKQNKILSLMLALLLLFTGTYQLQAQGQEIFVTLDSLTTNYNDDFGTVAQTHWPIDVNIKWSYQSEVAIDDYFKIKLDDELVFHANTEQHIASIYDSNNDLVAEGEIDRNTNVMTITFVKAYAANSNLHGELNFLNTIKPPLPSNPNTDSNDHYNVGYVQDLKYTVSNQDHVISVKHRQFPTVPYNIYHLNTWYNTTVLDYNVHWNPQISGEMILGYIDIFRGDQYQLFDVPNYKHAQDMVVSHMQDQSLALYRTDAGMLINTYLYDVATESYGVIQTRHITYDEIGYVAGSDTFTIDFNALGYPSIKDPLISYGIEFYMDYVTGFGYKTGSEYNNLSEMTFTDANTNIDYFYDEAAFWFPINASSSMDADPENRLVTLQISKEWLNMGDTDIYPDVVFKIYADGIEVELDLLDRTLKDGERDLFIRNLQYQNPEGKVIVYTVEELSIDGYTSKLDSSAYVFKFTNTKIDDPVIDKEPPLTPTDPTDKPGSETPSDPNKDGETLPNTGVSSTTSFYSLIILLGIGIVSFVELRKNKKSVSN